jgi:uncharacterized protein (DUF1684 family)
VNRILFILLFFGFQLGLKAQPKDSLLAEINTFQEEQNEHYTNKKTTPLTKKERRQFPGHRFYPVDLSYRVEALYEAISEPDTIIMPTSAGTKKVYLRVAYVSFKIGDVDCRLVAYQNVKLMQREGYEKYLFLPFRDKTSGSDSYGGGRYLDIEIPDGNSITLNFNFAYNPYCAYTNGWFCSIPPEENTLEVPIKAGLMSPLNH